MAIISIYFYNKLIYEFLKLLYKLYQYINNEYINKCVEKAYNYVFVFMLATIATVMSFTYMYCRWIRFKKFHFGSSWFKLIHTKLEFKILNCELLIVSIFLFISLVMLIINVISLLQLL